MSGPPPWSGEPPLPFNLPAFQKVADTGLQGYTLINGTGPILTWQTPNDGLMHVCQIMGMIRVTSAETGGQIQSNGTSPDGSPFVQFTSDAGGHPIGHFEMSAMYIALAPNTLYTMAQSTALTAGAAVCWAQIWGA